MYADVTDRPKVPRFAFAVWIAARSVQLAFAFAFVFVFALQIPSPSLKSALSTFVLTTMVVVLCAGRAKTSRPPRRRKR